MLHEANLHCVLALACAMALLGCLACRGTADEARTGAYAQWENGPPADPGYFPIAVWLQGPQNAARYKAAGINLYVALWKGPTEKQLADLEAAGMQVICDQNEVGMAHLDSPTIVGWMHGDEPDNAQPVIDPATGERTWGPCVPPERIVGDYHRIAAADPTRPVLLNLGQGVANDRWHGRGSGAKLSDYETYVKGGDIISFDIYPVASGGEDGVDRLWLVPKGVDRLVNWTGGNKIIWNCIECTNISGEGKASPEQVKAEVWMALIHGSTGLIYFVHQFQPTFCEWALLEDPEMLAAVTAINQQIRELAPVLNSPTIEGAVSVDFATPNVPVDAMVKHHEGATYVFAVSMRNEATTARFAVGDAGKVAEVIGEGRTIEVVDGAFEDAFTPYAVHLYRVTAN